MELFIFNEIAKAHPRLFVLALFLVLLVIVGVYWLEDIAVTKRENAQDDAPLPEGNTSMLFKYPSPITGKALHAQMNEAYFNAIFSAFLRSLMHAGYTLSPGWSPAVLLPEATLDILARDVDRARLKFMTPPGTDNAEDIDYHMQSGRGPKFLIQLIDSCERLGWRIMPVAREPEEECASSFSALP